ncbi:IF-2B-domain-containing protein [Dissoconium aciculare CBS 342.82]|uniref:Translation initiation factor eIF2B subunit delta n=1 Tax=Dissoconium aciculare CBS 342.82 TaxID=1314786 RepID=A0A6J3LX02_9PEZI|nr:IF-2B-domain-containing protein [Dissoconium aciculare CBS 342.82]KAF1819834.1 IF-2B-domain-containing protein [Dissoconium aciculare CBS 342.82]
MAETAKPEDVKLSPAELKKRAKAEKQARRAAQKEQEGGKPPQQRGPQKQAESDNKKIITAQQDSLPIRRRGSQAGGGRPQVKKDNKNVELFGHLNTQVRRQSNEGVSKDVHPSILALGAQISSYEICGSSARCVSMLLAFKDTIQQYSTPSGTSLARHMTSHHLSPQIDYLKSCRPISEAMGNAIRWLKKLIVEIDPSYPEQEAKDYLCSSIDKFIEERITVTDQAIGDSACKQIKNGSVVLTYGKSAIVEKTILTAHKNGTSFRVLVTDSRPLFEGKVLATSLMNAGLSVTYYPFSGITRAMTEATIVLLGAHSMLSNGRLQSRIGTASVAMAAHKVDVPVIVLCESVKFSGKVALDSIVSNELAPAEELILPARSTGATTSTAQKEDDSTKQQSRSLSDWRDIPNLRILNLMYDVTPAEYITMVICEYGSLPSTSVPVVHRLVNEGMGI